MKTHFIADLHLGDDAYTQTNQRGDPTNLRPFKDAADMDATIIRRWNAAVGDGDTVWVLGDVAKAGHLRKVGELRGIKKLVGGNRDNLMEIASSGLFREVCTAKYLPGILLTHIPVHPSQLKGRTQNIHGHLHGRPLADARYRCVSVDVTDFAPVKIDV